MRSLHAARTSLVARPARLRVSVTPEVSARSMELFGRVLSPQELNALSGAPAGAEVRANAGGRGLTVSWSNRFGGMGMELRKVSTKVEANIHKFDVHPSAPAGVATQAVARMVEGARAVGVKRIAITSGGTGKELGQRPQSQSGFYAWPRLGFDAPLDRSMRAEMPAPLNKARRLVELMATKAGREWWKHNGGSLLLAFDVAPLSASSKALKRYLTEKWVR